MRNARQVRCETGGLRAYAASACTSVDEMRTAVRTLKAAQAVQDQLNSPVFYLFVNLWTALILLAVMRAFLAWAGAALHSLRRFS